MASSTSPGCEVPPSTLSALMVKPSQIFFFFAGEYGRLRAIRLGPDGYLYISTSNRDGRGQLGADDDLILRVNPDLLAAP